MIKTEKQLYNYLKNRTPGNHWQRFEDRFSVGIPDTNVATAHVGEHWMELKVAKRVEDLVGIELALAQKAWMARRTKVLDNVWIVASLTLAAQPGKRTAGLHRETYPPIAFVRPKWFLKRAERRQVGRFTYHCLTLKEWNMLHDWTFAKAFLD